MSAIYQQFGVKSSFMMTWDGKGKLYWSPDTPVDQSPALAYAKTAGLPPRTPASIRHSETRGLASFRISGNYINSSSGVEFRRSKNRTGEIPDAPEGEFYDYY
jgi:hypothetical protein